MTLNFLSHLEDEIAIELNATINGFNESIDDKSFEFLNSPKP